MEECEKFTLSGIRSRRDLESKGQRTREHRELVLAAPFKSVKGFPVRCLLVAVSSIIKRLVLTPAELGEPLPKLTK